MEKENIRLTKKDYEKVLATIPDITILNRLMKSTKTKIIESAIEVKQAAQIWETNKDIQELQKFINELEVRKDRELELLVDHQINKILPFDNWDAKTLRWRCTKLKIPFNGSANKTELINKLKEASSQKLVHLIFNLLNNK